MSTKTFASRRLPIPAEVERLLPESGDGLMFATTNGNPVRPAAFRSRVFLPACDKAGVRQLRVHDLRHTCASLLASNGASTKSVQSWIGHQDLRVTKNKYTHTFASDLSQVPARIDRRTANLYRKI